MITDKYSYSQAQVSHTCNPSYSGGRDQEDCSSKPSQANSSQDLIKKSLHRQKVGLVEWLKVKALSSNPRPQKEKKEKNIHAICFQSKNCSYFM
jgi:hypothetical protein